MFSNYFFRVGKNIAKMSFWKRRTANITDYDPTYRVVYLGNVLTGWAKGKKDKRICKEKLVFNRQTDRLSPSTGIFLTWPGKSVIDGETLP